MIPYEKGKDENFPAGHNKLSEYPVPDRLSAAGILLSKDLYTRIHMMLSCHRVICRK